MMEESDILTLGWGCEAPPQGGLWGHHHGTGVGPEEFVTLEVSSPTSLESQEYVTLEVAKERDRQFFSQCATTPEKTQEWDILRLEEAPRPAPAAPLSAPVLPPPQVTYQEFILDAFQPTAVYSPYGGHYTGPPGLPPPTYHSYPAAATAQLAHPTPFYGQPADLDAKRQHTLRSPVSGKFVRTDPVKRPLQEKEKKRPPMKKPKEEREEEEYDPEVIANAHLTLEEEQYVCSVCKMKFKQPGNARRHIITVHRNEKPHICLKCDARFGRKDKLKTHMMRNHGYSQEDIKSTFKHSGQGRQRSSILVNRDNRKSTESSSSDEEESNPLNMKSGGPGRRAKHFSLSSQRKKKV